MIYVFTMTGPLRVHDKDLVELPDLAAARHHAVNLARSILGSEIVSGVLPPNDAIEVTDTAGRLLLRLPLFEAVSTDIAPGSNVRSIGLEAARRPTLSPRY